MHTRSLNKTFGIGRTTWDSFPEITATHRRLPPRPRLTWPLNRSQRTRGLKQAVNSPKSVCVFRWWNNYKLQLKTGGFDKNCILSLFLIGKSKYQDVQTGFFCFLTVDRFPACNGFTRTDIARHGSPQEGTYIHVLTILHKWNNTTGIATVDIVYLFTVMVYKMSPLFAVSRVSLPIPKCHEVFLSRGFIVFGSDQRKTQREMGG